VSGKENPTAQLIRQLHVEGVKTEDMHAQAIQQAKDKEVRDAKAALETISSLKLEPTSKDAYSVIHNLSASISNVGLLARDGGVTVKTLWPEMRALFSKSVPYKLNEKQKSHVEEWVSQMAVLALHIFFALTDYGAAVPATVEEVHKLLPDRGVKVLCDYLLAHLELSRQPDPLCEGLVLLHYCGHGDSADRILTHWYTMKKKVIWPFAFCALPCFDGFSKNQSKGDRSTSGEADRLLHFNIVLRYLARVRKSTLPPSDERLLFRVGRAMPATSPSALEEHHEMQQSDLAFRVETFSFKQQQHFAHSLSPLVLGLYKNNCEWTQSISVSIC